MKDYQPAILARNIRNKSNYYVGYSLKNNRKACFFNDLEYKNFLLAETEPSILKYCERPKGFLPEDYISNYIPNMWILYTNGKEEIVHTEYKRNFNNNSNSKNQIVTALQRFCNDRDIIYSLKTEEDLYESNYFYQNIGFLYGCLKRYDKEFLHKHFNILKKLFKNNTILSIKDIISSNFISLNMVYPLVAYGYCNGKLKVNLKDKILNYDTEVWLENEKIY